MQANAQWHVAVFTGNVSRSGVVPRRIPLLVDDSTAVPVDRIAEIRLAVDVIAHVLHYGQFNFHKRSIIAVIPVAHHTCSLKMGSFKGFVLPCIDGQSGNAEERGPV